MRTSRGGPVPVLLAVLGVLLIGCVGLEGPLDDGRTSSTPSAPSAAAAADRPAGVPSDAEPAIVDRVVDGDTVRVVAVPGGTIEDGGSIRIRLLNIDAPERARDGRDAQCQAEAATERVATLLASRARVWLVSDEEDRDRFDRPLRGLWTDDAVFVNELLAEEGLAEAVLFPPNDRFHDRIVAAERRAVAARLGIHGPSCR